MRTFKQRKITVGELITCQHREDMWDTSGLMSDIYGESEFADDYAILRLCIRETELFKILFAKGGI